jgi:hypothetical protein
MKIKEMFDQLGLDNETINEMIEKINIYNDKNTANRVPVIDPEADIDTIMMSQMALIGKAIAKVRGVEYFDKEKRLSLVHNTNAMRLVENSTILWC